MRPRLGANPQLGHSRVSESPARDWNNEPQRPQWNQNMLELLTDLLLRDYPVGVEDFRHLPLVGEGFRRAALESECDLPRFGRRFENGSILEKPAK